MMPEQGSFDSLIGRMDRLLSEMLIVSKDFELDEANCRTLKHHAEDMIGAAMKVLQNKGWKFPDHLRDQLGQLLA